MYGLNTAVVIQWVGRSLIRKPGDHTLPCASTISYAIKTVIKIELT